jgi:tripartite-type tricarboxylate transporter receptor subunit TctC
VKINAEANKALQATDMKEKLLAQGAEAVGNTPEFFGDYIKSETVKWAKVVKESGAKVD